MSFLQWVFLLERFSQTNEDEAMPRAAKELLNPAI